MKLKLDMLNNPKFRARLKQMLNKPESWDSLDINYHPPRVYRLSCTYMGLKINLHKIYPCKTSEALMHPHPWESVMEVLPGSKYQMLVGYNEGNDPKDVNIVLNMISSTGFQYAMPHKNGWHSVSPIDGCTYTLMITNKPWNRPAPKASFELKQFENDFKLEILNYFKQNFK